MKAQIETDFGGIIILSSFENAAKLFFENFNKVKSGFTEESVHDLRVSIRRLLALLNMINEILPLSYFTEIRKILKKLIKALNPLRDTQVQIVFLSKAVYNYPSLFPFFQKKLSDEISCIENFKLLLNKFNADDLEGLFFFQKLDLKNQLLKTKVTFRSFEEHALKSFQNLLLASTQLKTEDLISFHKLRLTVKRYRYIVEFLFDYINYPKQLLKKLKQNQNILGEIQDLRVLNEELNSFLNVNKDLIEFNDSIRIDLRTLIFSKAENIQNSVSTFELYFDHNYFKNKENENNN